jgi:AcrR family transcriptional regulator
MVSISSAPRTTRRSADATRQRLVDAAVDLFAERSFEGAATRDIATRAGVSQATLSYHFTSKDELWRAAVDQLFHELQTTIGARVEGLRGVDDLTTAKLLIREFVTFSAQRPELHRMVAEESKRESERLHWMIDTHIRPMFDATTRMFARLVDAGVVPAVPPAHLYFLLTGAGPSIFQLAPSCRRLAGFDPSAPEAVATHADAVVLLFFGTSS